MFHKVITFSMVYTICVRDYLCQILRMLSPVKYHSNFEMKAGIYYIKKNETFIKSVFFGKSISPELRHLMIKI